MILVLLGTQNKSFERLLNQISIDIKNGNIKDKVIVQKGCTNYKDDNMELFDYKPKEELNALMKKADLIITHGGVGTIIECLNLNKKIIAVPRLKEYKEHTNNHQLQIIEEFSKLGYIIPLYEMKDLNKKINEIELFKPNKYNSNHLNFVNKLKDYIDKI